MNIELQQVPGAWGTPSVSPFCTKLQCWLRMAELPYTVLASPDMLRAPRGKVPFVTIDGVVHTDSQHIITHLAALRGDPLDAWLTPEQRAIGHLVRRTLEEATYWNLVYTRWEEADGWVLYRPVFAALFPPVVRAVLPELLRRHMRQKLKAQGTGLHTRDEVHRAAIDDVRAVTRILGDKPFLLGDRPANVDATVFAFVDGLLSFPLRSPAHQAVWDEPALVAYANRVRARWFPELGPRS